MIFITILFFFILLLYIYLILSFLFGWNKIQEFKNQDINQKTFVSILIAARNEENNIANLLSDLKKQTISNDHFELIIIDDHSEDQTEKIANLNAKSFKNYKYILLSETKKGKKEAISTGVENAKGTLILTIDADVRLNNQWLSSILSYYEHFKPKMIIGPVIIKDSPGFFNKFQFIEFLSLIGSGAGAAGINKPIMCNGANLAFEKQAYLEYSKTKTTSYGDDVFFLLYLKKKYPHQLLFLKSLEATVFVESKKNLTEFINQHKRWASKSKFYKDFDIIFTAIIVFLTNLSLFTSFVLLFFIKNALFLFIILFLIKSIVDALFLSKIACFWKKKIIGLVIPSQFIYFFYICFTAISGLFFSFEWKKRKYI